VTLTKAVRGVMANGGPVLSGGQVDDGDVIGLRGREVVLLRVQSGDRCR